MIAARRSHANAPIVMATAAATATRGSLAPNVASARIETTAAKAPAACDARESPAARPHALEVASDATRPLSLSTDPSEVSLARPRAARSIAARQSACGATYSAMDKNASSDAET